MLVKTMHSKSLFSPVVRRYRIPACYHLYIMRSARRGGIVRLLLWKSSCRTWIMKTACCSLEYFIVSAAWQVAIDFKIIWQSRVLIANIQTLTSECCFNQEMNLVARTMNLNILILAWRLPSWPPPRQHRMRSQWLSGWKQAQNDRPPISSKAGLDM